MSAPLHLHHILLVEDSAAEVRLIQEAIREAGLEEMLKISYAYEGEQACKTIQNCTEINEKIDLVLLDLNMPRMNGKEVLSFIKGNGETERIPVFVLTNSDYKRDMVECYNLRADGYLQKPSDFNKLVDFFTSVKRSIELSNRLSVFHIEKHYEELRLVG